MDPKPLLDRADTGDTEALDAAVAILRRGGHPDELVVRAIDLDLAADTRSRDAMIRCAMHPDAWREREDGSSIRVRDAELPAPSPAGLRRVAAGVSALPRHQQIALVGHLVFANPAVSDRQKGAVIAAAGGAIDESNDAGLPAHWLATSEVAAWPRDYPEWTEGLIEGDFPEIGLRHTTWAVPLLGDAVAAAVSAGALEAALDAVLRGAIALPSLFDRRLFSDDMRWLREALITRFYGQRPNYSPWTTSWLALGILPWLAQAPTPADLERALRDRLRSSMDVAGTVWLRWAMHFDRAQNATLRDAVALGIDHDHPPEVWHALLARRERLDPAQNVALDRAIADLDRRLLAANGLARAVSREIVHRLEAGTATKQDRSMLAKWSKSHDRAVRLLAARPWGDKGDENPWPELARVRRRLGNLDDEFVETCFRRGYAWAEAELRYW